MTKKIAVIGGGITGLSAGFYIQKLAADRRLPIEPVVFEASDHLGGKFDTLQRAGYVIERGPDSFLKRKPAALELVRHLGLGDHLVENQTGKSYILKDGRLHLIPAGSVMGVPGEFESFLSSDLLSVQGKARVLEEPFLDPMKAVGDQSVGAFFEERLGREIVDTIIAPLLSGVYGGNLDNLSLEATLPHFKAIAGKKESLLRAVHAQASGKKKSQFATLDNGLSALTAEIEKRLAGKIHASTPIRSLSEKRQKLILGTDHGEFEADAAILALPLSAAQILLPDLVPLQWAGILADSGMTTVSLAFDQSAVTIEQEGTGFVSAEKGAGKIAAATWTHLKWPHTVPAGKALLRIFFSHGSWDPQDLSDQQLAERAQNELNQIQGIAVQGKPEFAVVTHMPRSMPQYAVGHRSWLAELRHTLQQDHPRLKLAGMSYDGVGIPDVIRQGQEAAEELLTGLWDAHA
ncbi:MAG: protoporphyrinogen oxidase [Sporolactobacillus sp.]